MAACALTIRVTLLVALITPASVLPETPRSLPRRGTSLVV